MTFAYWMILAAAFLPYATILLAKAGAGIDNRAPRRDLESLIGWRKRADWAHRNHFEVFPIFAAAVIVAALAHEPQARIDELAGAFVALRILYTAMYVADWATARSVVWALGFLCILGLFVSGA